MISKQIINLQRECSVRGKEGRTSHFEKDYHYAATEIFNDLPHSLKLAKSMAYAIANMDIWAFRSDNIGGRIFYNNEEAVIDKCLELDYVFLAIKKIKEIITDYEELIDNQLISCLSDGVSLWCNGHIAWNYDKILSLGVTGLRKQYEEALTNSKDNKAKEFYEGVIILLDALLDFNDKHINEYEKLGNYELAERMRNVPRYPCKTFKDAVQSFYLQHIVVMRENPFGGNSPGRLDYYLWPYLKKDLEEGTITLEEAKELIDELFLRIDERLYNIDSWSETIVVGGTDEEGNSSVNPLTYIMVESIIDLKIIHPSLYIRIPKNPPAELLRLAARYMKSGSNRAQILNDKIIIEALVNSGVEYKDAVHYICGGCMEIGIQGKNCDFLYGGFQNTLKMLELMITGGTCLKTNKKISNFNYGNLFKYDDFESFYIDYIKVAKKYIHLSLYIMDIFNELAEVNRPSYLLSSMIDECYERGRNLNAGGAKYHDYGSTPMALPDSIDCLYAIKYAVFDNKICTKEELIEALFNNFKGYESLQYKLKSIPKYGEDNEEVDMFARRVVSDFAEIYNSYITRYGGRGKAIILTFMHAPAAASVLGARASGKFASSNIAQGLTPNSSSMTEGITAAINSCCRLPFDRLSGGASTMWDFDLNWATEEVIVTIIKTFIDKKGQIFQGNITSIEELISAQKNPENYPNLFVRVGGYSARFINLSPELQNDIITRIRHNG